ncbi:MAG: hypothetical protein ABI851_15825 [Saprospiraceae bacterium]
MKNIDIYLIVDEFDSHRDLFCKIPKLDIDLCLDSYHLHFLFYDPETDNNTSIIDIRRKVVKTFLSNWYNGFEMIKLNKLFILPIGIYDQCIIIIKFKLVENSKCEVSVGTTEVISEPFEIKDVNTYYKDDSITYFEESNISIFNYNDLVLDFKESIDNIDICQVKKSQLKPRNLPGVTIIYPKDK